MTPGRGSLLISQNMLHASGHLVCLADLCFLELPTGLCAQCLCRVDEQVKG